MDRRRFLRAAAAAGIPVALAGCTGDGGDGGGSPTDTPTDAPTATATASPTATEGGMGTSTGTDSATGTEDGMGTPTEGEMDTPTEGGMDGSTATESPTASPEPTPTETPTPSATPTPQPDMTVDVAPEGRFRFSPDSFEISAGDTVLWVWRDGGHNVKPESGAIPSGSDWTGSPGGGLETYSQGYRYAYTFETTGTYEYKCNPHQTSGMRASFTVQ